MGDHYFIGVGCGVGDPDTSKYYSLWSGAGKA